MNFTEFIIITILVLIGLIPFYILASFIHLEETCYGKNRIKELITVDRGNYIYLLDNGLRYGEYYHLYQNGDEICTNGVSKVVLKYKPLFNKYL